MSDWQSLLGTTRQTLRTHGHVLLSGLAPEFPHVDFFEALGEVLPQYGGTKYWPVKPDPRFGGYDSRSTGALNPHTDAYEYPGRAPRYVALQCVSAPTCGGGLTQLADGYAFWEGIDDVTKQYLKATRFRYHSTQNLNDQGIGWEGFHPFAEDTDAGLILRVSLNNVETRNDPTLLAVHEKVRPFFDANHFAVQWNQHDILLWDNWRWWHSRTAFTCLQRHLTRVWYVDMK